MARHDNENNPRWTGHARIHELTITRSGNTVTANGNLHMSATNNSGKKGTIAIDYHVGLKRWQPESNSWNHFHPPGRGSAAPQVKNTETITHDTVERDDSLAHEYELVWDVPPGSHRFVADAYCRVNPDSNIDEDYNTEAYATWEVDKTL